MKILSKDILCPSRDWNQGAPEYESRALLLRQSVRTLFLLGCCYNPNCNLSTLLPTIQRYLFGLPSESLKFTSTNSDGVNICWSDSVLETVFCPRTCPWRAVLLTGAGMFYAYSNSWPGCSWLLAVSKHDSSLSRNLCWILMKRCVGNRNLAVWKSTAVTKFSKMFL
jgi:hypothetical protein